MRATSGTRLSLESATIDTIAALLRTLLPASIVQKNGTTKGEKRRGNMREKYDALYLYLKGQSESSVNLSLSRI